MNPCCFSETQLVRNTNFVANDPTKPNKIVSICFINLNIILYHVSMLHLFAWLQDFVNQNYHDQWR